MLRLSTRLLVLIALVIFATPAAADTPTNDSGQCVSSGQVWLLVVDDTDQVLINECVGTPETGSEALAETGVAIDRTNTGLVCSIGGHPEQCPRSFTGQFWNYHYAQPGQPWTYADQGPDQHHPQPGSIEGWCYNPPGTNSCTPPMLEVIIDGQVQGANRSELEAIGTTDVSENPGDLKLASSATLVWVSGGIAAALVLCGLAVVLIKRRTGQSSTVGGR